MVQQLTLCERHSDPVRLDVGRALVFLCGAPMLIVGALLIPSSYLLIPRDVLSGRLLFVLPCVNEYSIFFDSLCEVLIMLLTYIFYEVRVQ